ncbi:hypothetical protein GCM10010174_50290 [Kutzneria viridogrisea]|uniref:Methyltransferase FkbM domain-containing protein n=2 Tax=Kutzneria TaxID=43356 RepID=W5WM73_9PSEU|nr:FkbM family methyltransferase [Kutzneria albida]AHH99269.1 hypothetical protein KALB_5908 [Kutzneria albida DSM 43870]MBA8923177.1 FkbM family methyltransferase [Kutzneria viridogrisea]
MTIDPARIEGINRHETEFLYEEIFRRRTYLPEGLSLPPGAVVFDVGANIGVYSLFVHTVSPGARVYAFEPLPPVFAKLAANLARHGVDGTALPHGLSDVDGECEFTYYPGYTTMSARADYADTVAEKEFVKQQVLVDGAPEVREYVDELLDVRFRETAHRCRLRRLSSVLDELDVPRIDMLKIDVQRAELDVLRGIEDRHWPLVGQVVLEVHDQPGTATEGRVALVGGLLADQGLTVTVQQEDRLTGTDRYTLFAVRTTDRPGGQSSSGAPVRMA